MEDQVSVTAAEGTLTLKNLTDTPLGTVSVRYKNRLSEGLQSSAACLQLYL